MARRYFVLEDGRVVSAEATYPGADLRFIATVEDEVQSAVSEAGFLGSIP